MNNYPSSDLIIESSSPERNVRHTEENRRGFTVISSSDGSHSYSTVVTGTPTALSLDEKKSLCRLIGDILTERYTALSLPVGFVSLTVGLGNPTVTSDSLGSQTAARVLTDGTKNYTLFPSTKAKTGFDSAMLVRLAANKSRSDVIIAVDSLAARYKERLGTVVQISDAGIVPGSGVGGETSEISSATMPCPVISIGVPTVIRSDILGDDGIPMFVSPAAVDAVTDSFAQIISGGINITFGQRLAAL